MNAATPAFAVTGPPPVSVPPPALLAIVSPIPLVAEVTRLANASRISTCTAGAMFAAATTLLGCTRKARLWAAAGCTTTVASWVIATVPTVAETSLASAFVALSSPIAAPFASVGSVGWVSVFAVPVAANATVFPLITFPN